LIFFWIVVLIEFAVGCALFYLAARHWHHLYYIEWRGDLVAKGSIELVIGCALISTSIVATVVAT